MTVRVQERETKRLDGWLPWIGRAISAAPVLILLMSARWKLTLDPWYSGEWARVGWDVSALPRIGLIQLTCVALYLIPQTAVLGTVLPWVAVIMANDRPPKKRQEVNRYQARPDRQLESRPHRVIEG